MTAELHRLTTALADRYRLDRELGQGGMATVYLAADLKHDRKVAIKVLHPELSAVIGGERFLSEIKTTASLQHPHIPFEVTVRTPLFRTAGYLDEPYHQAYDALPDGSGFILLRPVVDSAATGGSRLVRVENWLTDLEARTKR